MSVEDPLRNQDWGLLMRQLTNFAYRLTRRRSWEHAEDLAQTAIADVFMAHAWDPSTPLLKYLALRVLGLQQNEARRHRTRFEVAMDERSERVAGSAEHSPEEGLAQREAAATFRARLDERLAGDDTGSKLVALFLEGVETPQAQRDALGCPEAEMRNARKRVFRHAERIASELADMDEAEAKEAAQ